MTDPTFVSAASAPSAAPSVPWPVASVPSSLGRLVDAGLAAAGRLSFVRERLAPALHAARRALRPSSAPASADVVVRRVASRWDLETFVRFPWRIYRDDPNWVPPLLDAQRDKLDVARNPFWRENERELFIAWRGNVPVGTVAAIWDRARNRATDPTDGVFGFFECVDDVEVARALLDAAAQWLRARGMTTMTGPFSPTVAAEHGVLLEGHDTRPALMEAHTPSYYPRLLEACGMVTHGHSFAWLVRVPEGKREATAVLPEKLFEFANRARERKGVRTRAVDLARWDDEVRNVQTLYNAAMATVPGFVPISEEDFRAQAAQFRPFVSAELVRFLEVDGRPVAFALALPDLNEAIRHANGELLPLGALKIWWHKRRLARATFKILVVLPEFRRRGLEALLIAEMTQAMIDAGYTEADLSHTGEENTKINFYLQALGLTIYRRYRIYRRDVA